MAKTTKAKRSQRTRARVRTAFQLARQEKCFELSVVRGKTTREIALEMKISRNVVMADIHAEQSRRFHENADRREFETARAVGFYERIISRAMVRADIADKILQQIADGEYETDENGHMVSKRIQDRSLDTALKARERIDKLVGIEAPEKNDGDVKITIEGGLPPSPR